MRDGFRFIGYVVVSDDRFAEHKDNQRGQQSGMRAVGVEPDTETECPDAADKVGQVGLEGRLTTRDDHTFEPAAPPREVGEHLALVDVGASVAERRDDERRVVAVPAAEVTPLGEHDRCEYAVPVEQALLYIASDTHGSDPVSPTMRRSNSLRAANSSRLPSFHWLTGRM